jgi:hypothetical protein
MRRQHNYRRKCAEKVHVGQPAEMRISADEFDGTDCRRPYVVCASVSCVR